MAKTKPITLSATETELAGLITTRTNLQARQSVLATEVEQAVTTRRRLLIEGGDAFAIAEAERACREIEGTAYGVTDALAEVDRRISIAETQIVMERAHSERERVAGGLERNAAEIQGATASLTRAIGEVVKAHAMLAITISGAAAGQFDPQNGIASPAGIANALTLQGLVKAMPGIEIRAEVKPWSPYSITGPVEPIDPIDTVTDFANRLRETAEKVRSQHVHHELPAHEEPMPNFLPNGEEVEIFVLAQFYYLDARGARTIVSTFRTQVPLPVAERAIEAGVASDFPTREWQQARQPSGSLPTTTPSLTWEDCVDIEFDLAAWRRAETERQRNAWLAQDARAAA